MKNSITENKNQAYLFILFNLIMINALIIMFIIVE